MSTGKVADGLTEGSASIVLWLGPGERLTGGGVNKHSEVLGVISGGSIFPNESGVAVLNDTNDVLSLLDVRDRVSEQGILKEFNDSVIEFDTLGVEPQTC